MRNTIRNSLVVATCVAINVTLIFATYFVEAQSTSFGDVLTVEESTQREGVEPDIDEVHSALDDSILRWKAIYLPALTLIVILFVGFFGRNWAWAWLVATLSLAPVAAMLTAFLLARPRDGIPILMGHLAICILASTALVRWNDKRRT